MPRNPRWLWLALLAALVIAALVLTVSTRTGTGASEPGAAPTPSAGAPAAGSASPLAAPGTAAPGPSMPPAGAPRAIPRVGARTILPRPPPRAAAAGDAAVPRAVPTEGLRDRRGKPPSEQSKELMEHVKAGLDLVEEDVEACIKAWTDADPSIQGKVLLGFQIGEDGLGKVWIQDYEDVPRGPLTCFASAVYDVDWSGMTDEGVEITVPFEYGGPDAGP